MIRLSKPDHVLISLFEHDLLGNRIMHLVPYRPDREHGDDNRDELQQYPQLHQFLGPVRRSAPHHVKKTQQQHQGDGSDRDRKKNRAQE